MCKKLTRFELLGLALWLAALTVSAVAQSHSAPTPNPNERAQAKQWVDDYLRYYQFEAQVTPAEVEQLVEWRLKINSPATGMEERQAAHKGVIQMVFRLANPKLSLPEQVVTRMAQAHAQVTQRNLSDPTAQLVTSAPTPLGQLGPVEKRGRGPVPLILIAPTNTDWTIYQSFMERNASRYTMYAVTLPGYGSSPAPPRPATMDLSTTPWFDGAERGVWQLIEKNKLSKPVLVGMTTSASMLALRLALHQPEQVRAVVLLDGAISSSLRSAAKPEYPATPEELRSVFRAQPSLNGMIAEFAPKLMFPRATLEARVKAQPAAQVSGQGNVRDLERARQLSIDGQTGSDPRASRYLAEQFTTDLTGALQGLRVPLLSIVARHDDHSPGQFGFVAAQWNEMKLRYPTLPLTVVQFENTRSYITEEAPQELDRALAAFLAGQPVAGKSGRGPLAARPSPRAGARQAIGATEITINYSRPQVKQREIWGKLVPYNTMWRAGADEATEISFSGDVLVEGQKLPAGRYTFLVIPAENEWTLVFNRVTDQWGTFPSYNANFDALRVKVKPQAAELEEWLSYGFENLTPQAVQVALRWEKLKALFKVELGR